MKLIVEETAFGFFFYPRSFGIVEWCKYLTAVSFILWVIFQNEIASLSKYVLAFTIGVVSLSVFINASQTLQS